MMEQEKVLKNIVGVRFKEKGKTYTFDATDVELNKGDKTIVNTENGCAIGVVMTEVMRLPEDKLPDDLKKVIRKATGDDLKVEEGNIGVEKEAFAFCAERIKERELPMKLVDVERLFDKTKMIFYFIAENRVDFRELVKDLVQKFRTRIELRQIWVRSEARITGGMGICGRELCCSSFLNNFAPVSIKMAKEQSMLLNPEKISGLCGRLMCCLAFEYDDYARVKKSIPKCGKTVYTPEGRGKVIRQNVLEEKVVVRLEEEREIEVSVHDIMEKKL
jgi:cell fate regulator YaaT (PSP1 superfamily)